MGRRYRDIVRTSSQAKRSARAVMMLLADYADDDGLAWPGHERIATECGLSERTVTRVISNLIETGEIEIETQARRHDATTYRLLIRPATRAQGRQNGYSKGRQNDDPGPSEGRHPDIKGRHPDIKGRHPDIKGRHPDTLRVDILTPRVDILTGQGRQNDEPTHTRACAHSEPQEPDQEPDQEPQEEPFIPSPSPSTAPATDRQTFDNTPLLDSPIAHDKPRTPQQEMYAAICEAVGMDYKIITDNRKVQIAQTVRILSDNGYGVDDVRRFMVEIWFHDWRWEKNQQRPTLTQLREEIGKLRAPIPVDLPVSQSPTSQLIDDVLAGRIK
jgi:hypothetical protein